MKRKLLSLAALLLTVGAAAQNLHSGYFTDGYTYRHEMNPAFGADGNGYVAIPALGNINVRTQGNFGLGDVMFDNPSYPATSDSKKTTFMNSQIPVSEALSGFNKGENRILGDVKLALLSVGFRGMGGFNTIDVNVRGSLAFSLPYELFEFAKNAGNGVYDIGNISEQAMAFTEIALGHSHKIDDQWRVGGKVKAYLGVMRMKMEMEDMKAGRGETGSWTMSGSTTMEVQAKGFSYDTDDKDYVDGYTYKSPGISGFGLGLDIGAEYRITPDLAVSAALLDLGFISWSKNKTARNKGSFEFNGFHNATAENDDGLLIDDEWESYRDQLEDFVHLTPDAEEGSSVSSGVGTTVNVGVEYTLPMYRALKFGLLGTSRLQSKYGWTEARLSANYAPLSWLDGGVNFAVGTFGTSMGWLLNIHPVGFNFFVGMDHIIGHTYKYCIPTSSNANVALGFNVTW